MKILVLNGPNLNLLGERQPDVYGSMTLNQMNRKIQTALKGQGVKLIFRQFSGEGEIIDCIHQQRKNVHGIVLNPGAYSHYSYAIRDAIAAISIPVVEVHLSDLKKREKFRRVSVIKPVCIGQVMGAGWRSYVQGVELLQNRFLPTS